MKRRPMSAIQATLLASLATRLDRHDDPQARARAAGIRGRLPMRPRISYKAAQGLADNALIHLNTLDLAQRAAERREAAQ